MELRKIVFRGKSKRNGEWLFGDLVRSFDMKRSAILVNDKTTYDECEVDTETVGQFTGLLDKNGKEIYEGDIVHNDDASIRYVVEWKHSGFAMKLVGSKLSFDGSYFHPTTTVIGNIHDNPDLVKECGE